MPVEHGEPWESAGEPLLRVENLTKTFAGTTVLRGASLSLWAGEVHGLLGENGSGKSTLIKILAGYHAPDPGAVLALRGRPVALPLPASGLRPLGVAFVHQDLGLFDEGTVVENLRVGRYETGFGARIRWRDEERYVRSVLEEFELGVDPTVRVATLSEVDRALVAILRALDELRQGPAPGVLVLDEPTSYLPRDGIARLFAAVRAAATQGVAILFVTHDLEEVRTLTDRVTVLRNGRVVHSGATRQVDEEGLVRHILGAIPPAEHGAGAQGTVSKDVVAEVAHLSSAAVRRFDVAIRRGEIVGVTGLVGGGWEEIPYVLFGATRARGGTLTLLGAPFDLRSFTPREARRNGLALVPANRLRDGAAPLATVSENMTLPTLMQYYRHGAFRHAGEAREVERMMSDVDVRPPEPQRIFSTLSGGNQQKVIIAKWLATSPVLLIMHEPTHGVDVGARRQLLDLIQRAAHSGTSCLICSSEHDDLGKVADRVIVMRDGVPKDELWGNRVTAAEITARVLG